MSHVKKEHGVRKRTVGLSQLGFKCRLVHLRGPRQATWPFWVSAVSGESSSKSDSENQVRKWIFL